MTRDEFEHTQRRLEEARRAGLHLVETAYQAQMRALDMVWKLQSDLAEEPLLSPAPAPAADPPPPRRDVREEVQRILADLPESFTSKDVCALLGYKPERSALYRALEDLRMRGAIVMARHALGPKGTAYRRLG
jgi:hypothetical protein